MIGIFDSGFGGLAIVKELLKSAESYPITYVADHRFIPYGNKSTKLIKKRSHQITEWLISQQAKLIIIACNTATTAAISSLRHTHLNISFVGIEPAVKPASKTSRPAYILATKSTLDSQKYQDLLNQFKTDHIHSLTFPHWVNFIETRYPFNSTTLKQIKQDLTYFPVNATISLSCTHYIFFKPAIKTIRPDLNIIDPGPAVARQARRLYPQTSLKSKLEIYSTQLSPLVSQTASNLLQRSLQVKSINI